MKVKSVNSTVKPSIIKPKKSLLQSIEETIPNGEFKGITKMLEPHEIPKIGRWGSFNPHNHK